MELKSINLEGKFKFAEHRFFKIIAQMNDYCFKSVNPIVA